MQQYGSPLGDDVWADVLIKKNAQSVRPFLSTADGKKSSDRISSKTLQQIFTTWLDAAYKEYDEEVRVACFISSACFDSA